MKLRTAEAKRARIELIPLIDVVFLLLVFFIYAFLSMSFHAVIPVHLPDAGTGEAPPEGEMLVIGIHADGGITAAGRTITADELDGLLSTAAAAGRPVHIAGDRDARYAVIMQVCDAVRMAGITDFAFQVEREE